MNEMKKRRVESIKKRIILLESYLENPDALINIAADGMSENWVARETIIKELDGLYKQYDRLTGASPRLRYMDTTLIGGR